MKDLEQIKLEIKNQIIKELNLEELKPEDIDETASLFDDGLGLDSIDALELVVILEKYHGAKINNEEEGRRILQSIQTMAEFVQKQT